MRKYLNFIKERKQIIKLCKDIYSQRLTDSGGNVAELVGENKVLITPTGMGPIWRHDLDLDDLVLVDLDGNILEGKNKVSREISMHLLILKNIDQVTVSIHAHPWHCLVFASLGIEMPIVIKNTEKYEIFPITKDADTHTESAAINAYNVLKDKDFSKHGQGALLYGHGVIVAGTSESDVFDTLFRMETNAFCAIFRNFINQQVR